ncbi:EpsG family protein, partial [uncultured Sphingomonas sp.]|uniref:EpsG family protein n=1 Tax=uncultured Sphingomonas sp. TaxID=158754 RepID=UPI0025E59A21
MMLAFIVYFGLMLALTTIWAMPTRKMAVGVEETRHAATQAAFMSIALFTLVIGGRYNVGGDYFGYIDYYRWTSLGDGINDVVFEPGFLLLIQFLKLFGLPERSIIVASSFIQIGLFSLWLRKHPQIAPFAVFAFVALLLLDVNNIVRQGIAFFAILLALSAVGERRWVAFFAWGLFAYLFHRSALIIFPIGIALHWLPLPKVQLQVAALLFSYVFVGLFFNQIVGLFTLMTSLIGYAGYSDISRADLAFSQEGSSLNLGVY